MATKKQRKKDRRIAVTLRLTPELHKRLRIAAAHHDTTIQDLATVGVELALGDIGQ